MRIAVYGGCYISRFFRPTPMHNLIVNSVGSDNFKPAPIRGNEFYREALHWARTNFPYWERHGGKDHLIAFPHDEGACVAPIELANATLLSSWGRLEPKPHNATTTMVEHSWFVPQFVPNMYASRHCYDATKDIVMPVFTSIRQLFTSPHLHQRARAGGRPNLFHWRGQVLYHFPQYSLGIRQQVPSLGDTWHARLSIPPLATRGVPSSSPRCHVAGAHPIQGQGGRRHHRLRQALPRLPQRRYAISPQSPSLRGLPSPSLTLTHLDSPSPGYPHPVLRSTFCGVFPGNGWGHIETPILLGCIPVVIQVCNLPQISPKSPPSLPPHLVHISPRPSCTFGALR